MKRPMKKTYCVAIDVRAVYHVWVQATSPSQAFKMGGDMQTIQIRQDGKFIDAETEVVEVTED